MAEDIYAHWVHPSGELYTKETMRKEAVESLRRFLEEAHAKHSYPQDGSKGQAAAWNWTLLKSLEEV